MRNDKAGVRPEHAGPSTQCNVLFVDDDPQVTAALTRVLRKYPYAIHTAGSGALGLSVLEENEIDVVVSDDQMPGMSGTDFLARVRKMHPAATRIMLTGQASLEAAIRAINEGEIFRFVTKPCDPRMLVTVIEQAAQHRKLMVAARQLLQKSQEQSMLIRRLELANPGITHVDTDEDGAIVMTDVETSLEELLNALEG